MAETSPPPASLPPNVVLPELPKEEAPKRGCLKWGLVGCSALSVLLVIGLIFVGMRGMDFVMTTIESQVLGACTPAVTPVQRTEFQDAFKAFSARARSGKITSEHMSAFRKQTMDAVADGKVTPDELQALTKTLRELTK